MSSKKSGKLPRRAFLAGAFATGVVSAGPVRATEQEEDTCLFYEFTDPQVEKIIRDWRDDLPAEHVRILKDIESGRTDTNYLYSTPDGDFYDNGARVNVSDTFTSNMIYIYHESEKDYFVGGGEIGCERVPFERSTGTSEDSAGVRTTTETPTTTEASTTTEAPTTTETATPTTTARNASAAAERDTSTTTTSTTQTARTATESTVSQSKSSDELVLRLPTGGLPTELIAAGLSVLAVLAVQRITSGEN